MITRVATAYQAMLAASVITPIFRFPRTAISTPITASASATSSLHAAATTAKSTNHFHRSVRAAQYANSSGAIANASGWKNSHVSHWYVGLSSSTAASATANQ